MRRREDARNLRSKKPQHKDVSTAEDRPVLHTKYKWYCKIYMENSRLKTSIDIDVVGDFNFHGLVKSEVVLQPGDLIRNPSREILPPPGFHFHLRPTAFREPHDLIISLFAFQILPKIAVFTFQLSRLSSHQLPQ